MERIPGVTVRLLVDGEERNVEKDGYCGHFRPHSEKNGQTVVLEVRVKPGSHGYGIAVDGNKGVQVRRDWLPHESSDENGRLFRQRVEIKLDQQSIPHTEFATNNIRLLKLYNTGNVEIWTICLISQEGEFFLVIQRDYHVKCYYNLQGVGFFCPYFTTPPHEWLQLVDVLKKLFTEDVGVGNFVFDKKYQPEFVPPAYDLPEDQGIVLWWSASNGFGAVQTKTGTARVHWRQVPKRSRRRFLIPGEMVRFAALRTPIQKRPPATSAAKYRATRFQKEAVGISLTLNS